MGVTQTKDIPSLVDTPNDESDDLVLYRFKNVDNVKIDYRTTSVVLTDVLPLKFSNLNHGDVFLLDVPSLNIIYIWHGNESHPHEKKKASHIALQMNEDMGLTSKIITLDSRKMNSQEAVGFWKQFHIKANEVRSALSKIAPANRFPDTEALRNRIFNTKLFKIGEDGEDRPYITIVGNSLPLTKDILDSTSSFVLDVNDCINVYIWSGKYASNSIRSMAILKTEEIINRDMRDKGIERKLQWNMNDIELWDFKEMFFDWMNIQWDINELQRLEAIEQQRHQMMKEIERENKLLEEDFYYIQDSELHEDHLHQVDEHKPQENIKQEYSTPEPNTHEHLKVDKPEHINIDKPDEDIIENKIKPIKRKSLQLDSPIETENEIPVVKHNDVEQPKSTEPQIEKSLRRHEKSKLKPNMRTKSEKHPEDSLKEDSSFKDVKKHTRAKSSVEELTPEQLLAKELKDFYQAIPQSNPLPKEWTDKVDYMKIHDTELELAIENSLTDASDFVNTTKPLPAETSPSIPNTTPKKKRGHRRNLSAYIVEQPNLPTIDESSSHLLSNPLKTAAPSNRRKPTRNLARNISSNKSDSSTVSEVRRANIGGSYGLLRALGADLHLLQKKPTSAKTAIVSQKGQPRLIQIKGRRKMIVRQVRPSVDSLNSGDVFILDTGKAILYQWNGKESNRIEKGKAMDVIKNIKDKELSGLAQVIVLDEGVNDGNRNDDFWKILEPGTVQPSIEAGSDADIDSFLKKSTNLYQVVQAGDSVESELLATYPIKKELLVDGGCYILDCITEIYVWCGKSSKLNLRKNTLDIATHLSTMRDFWCAPIYRELPGGESVLFREKFANWGYGPPIQMQQIEVGKNVSRNTDEEKIDVNALFEHTCTRHEVLVDDGSGTIKIWRVVGFEKEPIALESYGHFYEGDSYLVLYSYMVKNKEAYVIYYWQGRKSTINEKGASALLTVNLEKEFEMAKEIRVVQGYEPMHFLKVFKKRYIVHKGKTGDKISNKALYEINSVYIDYTRVYQVDNVKPSFKSSRYAILFLLMIKVNLYLVLSYQSKTRIYTYGKDHKRILMLKHFLRMPRICFQTFTKSKQSKMLLKVRSLPLCGKV